MVQRRDLPRRADLDLGDPVSHPPPHRRVGVDGRRQWIPAGADDRLARDAGELFDQHEVEGEERRGVLDKFTEASGVRPDEDGAVAIQVGFPGAAVDPRVLGRGVDAERCVEGLYG